MISGCFSNMMFCLFIVRWYVCVCVCSKKPWQYSYKAESVNMEDSPTGKYTIRGLDDYDKRVRRHAHSNHLALSPPIDLLPYRAPLQPLTSRYSCPGTMDPQMKYDRMDYSAVLSAIHVQTLGEEAGGRRYVLSMGEEVKEPRIEVHSTLSKRLAYAKSLSSKTSRKPQDKECGCCSVCLLHGAPPRRYSAQGLVIGPAPLKASWNSTVVEGVAYPTVSVHGYSSPHIQARKLT